MNTFFLISLYIAVAGCILVTSGYIGGKFGEYERIAAFELKENCQSFNLVYRILFPVVFVFIFANIMEYNGIQCPHYWTIILIYWAIRFIYIIVKERYILTNKVYFFMTFCLSNITGYLVYAVSMKNHDFLWPDQKDLISQFWIVVILFIYKLLGETRSIHAIDENRKRRLEKYTLKKLNIFYNSYIKIINECTHNIEVIKIIFSIMIIEDFNRPKAIRFIEHTFSNIFKTKGIMQVKSKGDISDEESVRMASEIIEKAFNSAKNNTDGIYDIIENISKEYNPHNEDYPLMIREVYNTIKDDKIWNKSAYI